MKIAKYYWPGMYWIEIADKKGWFKDAGLNVELIDTNPDYTASLDDMVNGKMDVNDFYLFDFIKYNSRGADLVAVINSDISFGADGLAAKQEIKRIIDLKGKTIGLPKGSNEEYGLSVVLERSGLTLKDVIIKDVPGEKASQAFINGEVDAIFTWEPFVSEAIASGSGHKLFDSSEIPGLMPVVFAFHQKFIDDRPEDVQAFVNVWHKTMNLIKDDPSEAFKIIADIYKVTPKEVEDFAKTDKILDLRDNRTAFSYAAGFESLHGTARKINDFMIKNKMIDKRLDTSKFIDAQFIRGLTD